MFDLTKQKKSKVGDWEFDIEKDCKDPTKRSAIKEQCNTRVQQLKALLRQGDDKALFDKTQTLLHGYLAMQKVLERSQKKYK